MSRRTVRIDIKDTLGFFKLARAPWGDRGRRAFGCIE
jgi:hypothetical protein